MTKNSLNRRRFLSSGAAAIGSWTAAPQILRAREGVSANDKLNIGVVGSSGQGGYSINQLKDIANIAALCDVDQNRLAPVAKQFPAARTYSDFRRLVEQKDLDAVVVATPDHTHAVASVAAMRAGKHVYCEKPLCQSIKEARRMVQAVRTHKRVFQTGSMQRSSEEFRVACELVRNGIIGPITRVEVAVGGPAKPCDLPEEAMEPGLDWDRWLGPAPKRPYNSTLSPRGVHNHYPAWRNYREYGGGGVTDWGAHHFDIAQWGLGMDQEGPRRILPSQNPESGHGVRMIYQNGVEMIHSDGNGVTFHGKEGKIQVNRGKFAFWLGEKQIASDRKQCKEVEQTYLADAKVRLYRSSDHKQDFLDCVRNRTRPIADVEIGARTVTICHLVNLSYYHGQPMQWNARREQFLQGKGQAEWLDVDHRAPYQWTSSKG